LVQTIITAVSLSLMEQQQWVSWR